MGQCDCRSADAWEAWYDRMPGATPTLHVLGTCRCPTPGFVLRLRRHEPQGANPRDLLLDLVEQAPSGIQPEVITPTTAKYEEATDVEYETVTILPDGPTGIPVVGVSSVTRVSGTSFESFAHAAASALRTVSGRMAAAEVERLWISKGGVVGRVQYHAELVVLRGGETASAGAEERAVVRPGEGAPPGGRPAARR